MDEVLEGRAILGLVALCCVVIMTAVDSLFGKTGMSILWLFVQGIFYIVATFVTIKVLQLLWNLLKVIGSKI